MKILYLLRHGEPDLPGGERRCLGSRSDPPLSREGGLTASRLAGCFGGDLRLFSSPLLRCRSTALLLSAGRWRTEIETDLRALDAGDWDGLSFREIRERWPEHYERRGRDLSIPPPGGERPESAAERGLAALTRIMRRCPGDAAAVAHAGVNRAILCTLLGRPMRDAMELPQDCGCVNVLAFEEGRFRVLAAGISPFAVPAPEERRALEAECGTPERVLRHCAAVRETALELASGVPGIDTELLSAACELHDLMRVERDHPRAAAEVLRRRGYLRLARVIEQHHDCDPLGPVNEEKLLFLADKLVREDRRVTLEERFRRAGEKCASPEAAAALERRKKAAFEIMARIGRTDTGAKRRN